MKTVAHQPMTVDQIPRSRGLPTPVWLRTVSIVLAAGALAAGATAAVATLSRQSSTHAAISTAEPLVIDSETIDIALTDANTTIAGGFLGSPPVGSSVRGRYSADLATAGAALASAASRAGTDVTAARLMSTLVTGIPLYTQTVATAETHFDQVVDVGSNLTVPPVSAAYLAEANTLMQGQLLPAATKLYSLEQARLLHDERDATDTGMVAVSLAVLVAVLLLAVWTQAHVTRRFRRLVNVGLAATTLLVVGTGVWTVVATQTADDALTAAEKQGTLPLSAMTRARILLQQARADDELTLVTRDSDSSYQEDYGVTAKSLTALLASATTGWTGSEIRELDGAASVWNGYQAAHASVRNLDQNEGDLVGALASDQGGSAGHESAAAVFSYADSTMSNAVGASVGAFDSKVGLASSDLGGLALGCVVLMAIAALAAVVGLEPRIREYR
jgi:hypothetical protein